jgi:DNA-binding NarL/FixJ family response regulator
MALAKILLVDDDELVRVAIGRGLVRNGFEVTTAATVADALEHIGSQKYDVLLSKCAIPEYGDGLSIMNTIRAAEPSAVTLLLSGCPGTDAVAQIVRMQPDETFTSPDLISLVEAIKSQMANRPLQSRLVESVATILDRETQNAVEEWYKRALLEPELMAVPLSSEIRCAYLTQLFRDLVVRLRSGKPSGDSAGASQHGMDRCDQGYTAAMMVTESRMLQVTIFHTLHKHLDSIDCSVLLLGVMAIADECDSQLAQAMTSYVARGCREPMA